MPSTILNEEHSTAHVVKRPIIKYKYDYSITWWTQYGTFAASTRSVVSFKRLATGGSAIMVGNRNANLCMWALVLGTQHTNNEYGRINFKRQMRIMIPDEDFMSEHKNL